MSPRGRSVSVMAAVGGTMVLLALLIPLIAAVWMSFSPGQLLELPWERWSLRWYERLARDVRWRDSIVHSLQIGVVSAALATAFGTALAVGIAKRSVVTCLLLLAVVLMPLFIPPVVLGMGLLPLMILLGLEGSRMGLALAHAVVSLPVVFLVVRAALDEVGPELEQAARGLGASPA